MEGAEIVLNFAAESHVDRSITGPGVFVETNVMGTLVLLEAAKKKKEAHMAHVLVKHSFDRGEKGLIARPLVLN